MNAPSHAAEAIENIEESAARDPGVEERRHPRRSQLYAGEIIERSGWVPPEAVRVVDMSAGGACIRTGLLFEVGEELGFRLKLPSGRLLESSAYVRWSRNDGYRYAYGLEFDGLHWLDRRRLGRFLEGAPPAWLAAADAALGFGALGVGSLVAGDIILRQGAVDFGGAVFPCAAALLGAGAIWAWLFDR